MDAETPLEALRRRIGLGDVLPRIAKAGETGAAILPALNGILAFPGEPHLLHPTSALCGLTPFHFSRVWKHVLGVGFHEFADRARVEHALLALGTTDRPVSDIAAESGFRSVGAMDLSVAEYTELPLLFVLTLLRPEPA